jgi:hypothetical protein
VCYSFLFLVNRNHGSIGSHSVPKWHAVCLSCSDHQPSVLCSLPGRSCNCPKGPHHFRRQLRCHRRQRHRRFQSQRKNSNHSWPSSPTWWCRKSHFHSSTEGLDDFAISMILYMSYLICWKKFYRRTWNSTFYNFMSWLIVLSLLHY